MGQLTCFIPLQYLDQAIVNDQNNPGYTAGQLAQSVQRSEYPDRVRLQNIFGVVALLLTCTAN